MLIFSFKIPNNPLTNSLLIREVTVLINESVVFSKIVFLDLPTLASLFYCFCIRALCFSSSISCCLLSFYIILLDKISYADSLSKELRYLISIGVNALRAC